MVTLATLISLSANAATQNVSSHARAEALLTAAILQHSPTAAVELAVQYRDPRARTLLHSFLDPESNHHVANATLTASLAGAAEVLNDTEAVYYLWRRVVNQQGDVTPRLARAVHVLARAEHIPLIGYSLDSNALRVAELADSILRRIGAQSSTATQHLRNAIAVRSTWLETAQHNPDLPYREIARVRRLVKQHTVTAGLLGDTGVIPQLRSMLADARGDNQAQAARALARVRDTTSWHSWAFTQLHTPRHSQAPALEQLVAAELLAAQGDPTGRDLLVAWLYTGDERVQVEALCAMVRLATPALVPVLQRWRTSHPDAPHRPLAALALCAAGEREAAAEVWRMRAILRCYDAYRDPPLRPLQRMLRTLGRPPETSWTAPVWDEAALRRRLGLPDPTEPAAEASQNPHSSVN